MNILNFIILFYSYFLFIMLQLIYAFFIYWTVGIAKKHIKKLMEFMLLLSLPILMIYTMLELGSEFLTSINNFDRCLVLFAYYFGAYLYRKIFLRLDKE